MLKKILIALLVLLVAVGIGLYVFSGKLDGIIKETIETEGSAALGSAVRVSRVVTDFKQGRAEIGGLTISNPVGYQSANAIELSKFVAEVDYSDQTIKEVIINKPVINAEQKGTKNNFQDLLDKMPASNDEEPEQDTSTDPGPEITIKKIALRAATVNLFTSDLAVAGKSVELGNRSFVMKDYVVTDVTGTAEQISDEITRSLVAHISDQVKSYVSKEIKTLAKAKAIETAKEKAKEVLEEKLGGELGDKLNKEILGDKLKGKLKFKGFKKG